MGGVKLLLTDWQLLNFSEVKRAMIDRWTWSERRLSRLNTITACAFLLLYALAVVRPFVPGLCQGMFASRGDTCCAAEPERSCCAEQSNCHEEGADQSVPSVPKGAKRCPFCNLLTHPSIAEAFYYPPRAEQLLAAILPPRQIRLDSHAAYEPGLARDPPAQA